MQGQQRLGGHVIGDEIDRDAGRRGIGIGLDGDVQRSVIAEVGGAGHRELAVGKRHAQVLAELAAAGVASVLVPYPHAVDDHQTGNARFLAEAGAAVLMPQTELTPQRLAALLQKMNRERLLAMAVKARECAKPDATARVADVCAGLAA